MIGDDPFAHDDAAYVLGALDAAERAAFEGHLRVCNDCCERVARAAALLPALATVSASDLLDAEEADVDARHPVPGDLLAGVQRRAGRRRRRTLVRVVAGGAVAAGLVTGVVALRADSPDTGRPKPSGVVVLASQPMVRIGATSLTARATLVSQPTGTRIVLHCRQNDAGGSQSPEPEEWYTLLVYRRGGGRTVVGSWTVERGQPATYTTQTRAPADSIARVVIATAKGVPVLQLRT